MESNKRLDTVEDLVLNESLDAMALTVVVRALICTHPDLPSLGRAMTQLFSEREQRIRDLGFDRGYAAKTAGSTADGLRSRANDWLQLVLGDGATG